ncbi:MAG: D-glycero-beta-D-manno-heptose 1-phosphate adenylyltransferase [Candidatus Cloacimonetes bacterium]|nr:D-glycero-beta-D-manno-heptose 1-phosphate adenylyltransferase [Candidatus Cloacimonadota bacterium]
MILKFPENSLAPLFQHTSGRKIVFTNGCFDLLHAGHVTYLKEARALGDFLILGLNSDSSIKRLKGPLRPIVLEMDRALVLSELKSVDAVILFEDDTPYELIRALEPDVLVKGGDWKPEEIVGSDIVLNKGGIVTSLSFLKDHSTTDLIDVIRARYGVLDI